jgi:glycine/D-amino acid oxidase-like deaminating enzyme
VPRAPLPFDSGPSIRFPRQGQFHPLKYLYGLAGAIVRAGGRIASGAHADTVEDGAPARVRVGSHTVSARAVVVATNVPINDRFAIHTKQAPYMTYVIGAVVPRGSVERALYWDTGDPYHYVRLQPMPDEADKDCLIVGGEDHKSGHADDGRERHARLEAGRASASPWSSASRSRGPARSWRRSTASRTSGRTRATRTSTWSRATRAWA